MHYNVSVLIFFPSATNETEGYMLVQLDVHQDAGGLHRNERNCKYSVSAETQIFNTILEMWWRHNDMP